jgi:EAL domain-containing protein (putative c-di-GMP-specific phosphodiesterase class I)
MDMPPSLAEDDPMRSAPPDRCVLGRSCPSLGIATGRRKHTGTDSDDARAEAQDRRRLLHDLRQAVSHGGFAVNYQPRIALATGAIVGAEGTLRWPHRRHGHVSPDRFIPLLEQAGLLAAAGTIVLRTGCADAAGWTDARLTLSLSMSPRQLQAESFLSDLATAIDSAALAPERLEIQVSESMLLGVDDDTLFLLSALRDMGVGLALGDFGTGYASLTMLRRLPLTAFKLDRSLLRELPANAEDAAIVHAVVAAAHAMGLIVTADGVETQAQCDLLTSIGADQGQGRLFGRTMPPERTRQPRAA